MACRYTYQGKTYEAWEFDDVLRAMSPTQAARFMPGIASIPDAPMIASTQAWTSLAIKRAIMLAVEGGYDKVAMVTGQQAADFFDLSKQVQMIMASRQEGGQFQIFARDTAGKNNDLGTFAAEKLPDVVGKDLAEKIANQKKDYDIYEGVDLKVGGEGQKAYYDKIVPQVANDVLKKIGGGKVGEVTIKVPQVNPTSQMEVLAQNGITLEQWNEMPYDERDRILDKGFAAGERPPLTSQQSGFDITDSMREKLEGGMPLFSKARDVIDTPKFKAWFGKSMVTVDGEVGSEPQVMYHGSYRDLSWFDRKKSTEWRRASMDTVGSWFSDSPSEDGGAGMYATGADARIYPVYLRIERPKVYDSFREFLKDMHEAEGRKLPDNAPGLGSAEGLRDKLKAQGYDGIAFMKTENGKVHAEIDSLNEQSRAIRWSDPKKYKKLRAQMEALDAEIEGSRSTEFDKQYVWIAFEPEQIKSAVGNDGGFDPTNKDITRSTSRLDSIRDMSAGFGYKVADWMDSSKSVSWWDKSVGTPYHLAQKHPDFKRVYDSVQNFISDVSKYATRAADMAPTILPKLETLADIAKSPLSAADVEALAEPINKGTLVYTRNADGEPVEAESVGEAGVVWTDQELRDMWHLDERQRGLYREFRKATNKSIADLAITGMLRYAGSDAEAVRGRVLETTSIQQAAGLLADHLAELAAIDTTRANTLQNAARVIKEMSDQARGLIAKGYAPLTRFGEYTVYAPSIGEHGFFELFESERDANRRARQLRAEFPNEQVTTGTMSKEGYKLFKGVTPETLALFGDALGLEESASDQQSQVFQEYLRVAKSTRSAMRRLIERKGVEGYSNDVGRVLAAFVYSNGRQSATNIHSGEMLKATNEVKNGDLKDHAIRFLEYAQTPNEEAQSIRGLLFTQYIGGSIASALTNLTQSFTTTWPTLGMHFGIAKAGKAMAEALEIHRKGAGTDQDMAHALKRAELDGITAPQETHQLMAQAQGKGSLRSGDGTKLGDTLAKMSNGFAKGMFAWGKMFGWAEVVNREIAFAAAYKLSRDRGDANPYEFAKQIVADSQYTMNRGNNPVWARGPVGATLFTFKKFMVNYLEGLERMWHGGPEGKKAFALSLAIMFMLAGFGGFPFADDLDDILDSFAQRVLNKSWSTKQAKKEFFAQLLGDAGADFVMGGMSSLPGFPIDFSGRLGLGNIVPGTGLLTKKADHGRDVAEIGGAAADFGKRVLTAAGQVAGGEFSEAAASALPVALSNVLKAKQMAELGYYQDAKGRKVVDSSMAEAALKAIGFQPQAVKKVQDATMVQASLIAQNKMRETEIADLWARGRIERKPELIEDAKRQVKEWNASNPHSQLSVDPAQINKRVKDAMMDKAQRVAKTAPKEIRASVSAELKRELAE